ncbi:MAG TPA: hypothetical protein VGV68_12005 [Terriglobia bacterium]|nr:hypothetical protein [Terriglobia bacterium]
MKREIPTQLYVGLGILLIGGIFLGVEYFLVKWTPLHKQRVADAALKPLPYHNDSLGVDMQVAAGIYGKVENFPGGAKIFRPRWWGSGPSITLTSEPNVDHATEFSQEILAKWETDGVLGNISNYHFDHTQITNRDAVLIQRPRGHSIILTAHVISPERIIVAECSTGDADPALFLGACDESLRTLKIAGPEPPAGKPALEDVNPPTFTPPRVSNRH